MGDQSVPSWYSVHRNNDGSLTRFLIDPAIPIGLGALQTWKITPTGWKQALGSPYAMNPLALTVLSK